MHIVVVSIQARSERLDEFIAVTAENVRDSLKEPGVKRFDLLRQTDDPTRFLLIEAYGRAEDHVHHKATDHYKRWAEAAEPLMAAPRTRVFYEDVFPRAPEAA